MAQAVPQDLAALAEGSAANQRHVETAFLEAHDADIPSNDAVADGLTAAQITKPQTTNVDTTLASEKDLEAAVDSSIGDITPIDKSGPAVTEHEAKDPNLVTWEGPDDPANPMNWTTRRKWLIIAVVSSISFTLPLASSMFAPGVPQLMREFHSDSSLLASFVVSVFLLGFVAGPFVVAPMSELYGRMIIYHISNVIFLAFTIGCAVSTNLAMFCVFRFFMGVAGSAPLTVGGGSIADLMPQEKRGGALAVWAVGPLLGKHASTNRLCT